MFKFETSTHVNRPVAEVFNYFTDPNKIPEWNSIIEEAKASETPIRKGTKLQQKARFLGRKIESTIEITELEINKKVVQRSDKPFPVTITSTFEAASGGTNVVASAEAEPGGFFKVGEPIVARIAKHQVQASLETAKELLEAQVPAAS